MTEPQIDIDDNGWVATGEDDDPASRLVSAQTVRINGVRMHLEAIAVRNADGVQVADNESDTEALDRFYVAFRPDGGWLTTEIGGPYALFLEPHSR